MDWKYLKLISIMVAITLIAALSFAIGISFGVTFEQNTLTDVVIPVLSVMGNWVAGLGALAAVFTSLWLAKKQRENDCEKLKAIFDVLVFPPDLTPRLMVRATSIGNKPSNINSITIYSENAKVAMIVTELDRQGNQLPMPLSYGLQGMYILPLSIEPHINDYVTEHCSGLYKNLVVSVNTSLNEFKIPFNEQVIQHLKQGSANEMLAV